MSDPKQDSPSKLHAAPLWQWSALSAGLTQVEEAGPDVQRVIIDSRQAQPGDLFVALPGDPGPRFNPSYRSEVDGHDFVARASAAGAVGALVHKSRAELNQSQALPAELALLEVEDTYDGLWSLGALSRARLKGEVVAITGSSGKTTAKQFMAAALDGYAPPGSLNNHIGVPLALANAPEHCNSYVFEVGTNHPGEIEPLAKMIHPDVAVLLNVHSAHIENFADWQALKQEKVSIIKSLDDKSNFIYEDTLGLSGGLAFGTSCDADARILDLTGDRVELDICGQNLTAQVPGGGVHRATTVAATLLVLHVLGRELALGCELPLSLVPKGRGDQRWFGRVCVVDESYNANPDSMIAALKSFKALPGVSQRVAVLGEMLELGAFSAAAHLELAPELEGVEAVFCVGEGLQALANQQGYLWFPEANDELLRQILLCVSSNTGQGRAAEGGLKSGVFVKGSNRVFWANKFVERLADTLYK